MVIRQLVCFDNRVLKMADHGPGLLRFFKLCRKNLCDLPLPDTSGSLSEKVDSSAIEEANKEVTTIIADAGGKLKPYLKLTPKQKATIGRYTAENGIVNAIRHFKGEFPEDSLKESTIRGWKKAYIVELESRRRTGKDRTVKELPQKKMRHPLMLGENLDKQVQAYLLELGKVGGIVNREIAIVSARGIVCKKDSRVLAENGGHVLLTKDWAHYLLLRMGYVKRRANSKVKITVENFEEMKYNFLCEIKDIVMMEEIPSSMILNWDHTGLKYVPVSSWTMAKQGSKKVSIAGIDDKRQITGVFTITLDGQFLPPQLVYQGITSVCLPRVKFPNNWHVTRSPNHWANESTTKDFIQKIINPYLQNKRAKLKLTDDHHALCIFDNFKGQLTDDILQLLKQSFIDVVFVPPNCTDQLQPLDLSVNKSTKEFLRGKFQQWYLDKIFDQRKDGSTLQPVTFPMHVMKPLGAHWLLEYYSYMQDHPDIVCNGFRAAGITEVLG